MTQLPDDQMLVRISVNQLAGLIQAEVLLLSEAVTQGKLWTYRIRHGRSHIQTISQLLDLLEEYVHSEFPDGE